MDKLRLAAPLQEDSIVDGPGVRMVLWTQGCPHACKGCHNPHTHDANGGFEIATAELIAQMKQTQLQSGLTLSGGEPFLQSVELLPVVQCAKEMKLNIWAYSGFTYEQLLANETQKELLKKIDVLVDGKFIEAQKDYRLKFKGSRNQRIIDVQKSLVEGQIVLSAYDKRNQNL